MIPDFQSTKILVMEKLIKFFSEQVQNHSHGVLGGIGAAKLIHEGDGLHMQYAPNVSHESTYKKIENGFTFKPIEVANNPNIVYIYLESMARDTAAQQTKMIFESISDVTEKFGNVVKGNGKITPEDIFKMLEQIVVDFDYDGNPNMPSIHAGEQIAPEIDSALTQIQNDPKLTERFIRIMEKQKSNWNDRENNRKLVG